MEQEPNQDINEIATSLIHQLKEGENLDPALKSQLLELLNQETPLEDLDEVDIEVQNARTQLFLQKFVNKEPNLFNNVDPENLKALKTFFEENGFRCHVNNNRENNDELIANNDDYGVQIKKSAHVHGALINIFDKNPERFLKGYDFSQYSPGRSFGQLIVDLIEQMKNGELE